MGSRRSAFVIGALAAALVAVVAPPAVASPPLPEMPFTAVEASTVAHPAIVATADARLEWVPPDITVTVAVGTQAVDVARGYIGTPYVWGGEDPSGFDCSGLIQHVYGELGIRLPRTTTELRHAGVVVDDPQPGDLVWYPGHIGLYSGDGNKIHAPYSGTVVQEVPIWNPNDVLYIRVT